MAAASEVVAEDRQLLQHEAHLVVVIDELDHVGQRAAAIAAIVVEELDHAHIAVGVAGDEGERRAEDGVGILADDLLLLRRLLGRLALVELGRHLDQDLGVLGEIVAHDVDDLLVLDRASPGAASMPGATRARIRRGWPRSRARPRRRPRARWQKACLEVHA